MATTLNKARNATSPASKVALATASAADRLNPGSARSFLLTLLGEFVLPRGRPVWTSALLHAYAGVGIAEKAARQALMRAADAGWIEAQPVGRQTSWTVSELGRQVIDDGAQRVRSTSRRDVPWDGRWRVLVWVEPDADRVRRQKVARALSWIGFGNPAGDLWVSPHGDRDEETRRVLLELGISAATYAFTGPSSQTGMSDRQIVERSWDLGAVAEHYGQLIKRFGKLRPGTGDPMLFSYTQLVNEWQRLPFIDPALPPVLLPAQWSARDAAARLDTLREQWRDDAHKRWDEVAGVVPTL